MEKRSGVGRVRKSTYVAPKEVKEEVIVENTGESPETVRLVCVVGAGEYIITSPNSGKEYHFIGNRPTEVDKQDENFLLSKKRGCCGTPPQPIFVKV